MFFVSDVPSIIAPTDDAHVDTIYPSVMNLKFQVPFVGFNVVKQAECMASHGVFIGIQACFFFFFFTATRLSLVERATY